MRRRSGACRIAMSTRCPGQSSLPVRARLADDGQGGVGRPARSRESKGQACIARTGWMQRRSSRRRGRIRRPAGWQTPRLGAVRVSKHNGRGNVATPLGRHLVEVRRSSDVARKVLQSCEALGSTRLLHEGLLWSKRRRRISRNAARSTKATRPEPGNASSEIQDRGRRVRKHPSVV